MIMPSQDQIKYDKLPEHIRMGMRRYIEEGIIPGSFLQAVIQDKLVESFAMADETNIARMFDIACFMYHECPRVCRGSEEVMKEWHERGGLNKILSKGGDVK